MSHALITPSMLTWARVRAALTPERTAEKVSVQPDRVREWEAGKAHPTLHQARNLAHALHVPFGYLFLKQAPEEQLPIADLRTVGNRRDQGPSAEFRDVLYSSLRKQEWFREELKDQDASPLPFVGSLTLTSSPFEAANLLRETLVLGAETARKTSNWTAFLSLLVERAEGAGILVFKNGIVGSNTSRSLEVEEFRGFALSDPLAPAVFVNNNDAVAAKIFTFVHELAHLWAGTSGVSDSLGEDPDLAMATERWCDQVAVEVLCPAEEFRSRWAGSTNVATAAAGLARTFKVSTLVVLRRALDLGLLGRGLFFELVAQAKEHQKVLGAPEKGSGGPGPAVMIPARNGKLLSRRVLDAMMAERLSYRDAALLLDTSVGVVEGLVGGIR